MELALPLDQMSTEEKLRALEMIWADLSQHEDEIESPSWHGDVLKEREERVASGKESFVPWEEAKAQLRKRRR
ncbi:MAG: acyl-protein synthetase [Verrucomicrobia bacterium]|nr:MAG: acyl-protein synthetase [Verrucomicrobiota bacterium]